MLRNILVLFMITTGSLAQATAPLSFGGKKIMNHISLDTYENFQSKWNLVTVRYREDTGEMRWVYANDLAWKTLSSGKIDYPTGSVFAKIAVATSSDPKFTSSRVPSGVRRTQFMVRDQKSYSKTGGWGYALFNQDGETFDQDPKLASAACYACHRIVPERGEVFSQISNSQKNIWSSKPDIQQPPFLQKKVFSFSSMKASDLPEKIMQKIPSQFSEVHILKGEISEHMFDGTVDEIRPLLSEESFKHNLPALILSKDSRQFSLVYPITSKELNCKSSQKKFAALSSLFIASSRLRSDPEAQEEILKSSRYCFSLK